MRRQMMAVLLLAGAPHLAAAAARDTIPGSAAGLGAEHAVLLRSFTELMQRATAATATRSDRASLVLYLRADLLPHARAEERILYPALDSVLKSNGVATAALVLDHRAIERLVNELGMLAAAEEGRQFERKVWGLDAILESHFDKEEQFVMPTLRQKMTEREIRALLVRMGEAEHS